MILDSFPFMREVATLLYDLYASTYNSDHTERYDRSDQGIHQVLNE